MKKLRYLFLLIVILPFFKVKAVSSYSVEMVSNSFDNKKIQTYSSYNEALEKINSLDSNNTSVATIFKDGIPVDSKYAIFKFKPGSVYKLYKDSNSSSSYTSIHGSYSTDAALLGYSDNGRVKIMISGFIGWTSINNGVITPISLIGGNMINVNGTNVNLRSDHSTKSLSIGKITGSYNFNYTDTYNGSDYTWYKINYNGNDAWVAGGSWTTLYDSSLGTYYKNYGPTGNLIHHFTYYAGLTYQDSFTNLGSAPSYLVKDKHYYSFDGNYFYDDLKTMLDDYRNGIYSNSINKDNPHYSYYLYLTAHSTTGYSAEDLDNIISSKGYNADTSKMYNTGIFFKQAEETYGTNALLAFSAALNESNWGTSKIAMDKNNLFGYGAADSCPYECAYSYNSPSESIMEYASKSSVNYEDAMGKYYFGSHYGNKSSGKNVMYATDPYWGETMAGYAYTKDLKFGGKDFNSNTIGVSKKGISNIKVYKSANLDDYAYTMKNSKSNDLVYDFSINIMDKISNNDGEFYKIYTDLSGQKYGYVLAKDFNVSNTQPVIKASDKDINLGSVFDYMNDVVANDKEDGDITSKITYEGVVDTSKIGDYKVTYTVSDKSNFHASKSVNIKVIGKDIPTIEANDIEITQFDEFDYMKNIKAQDSSGDISSKVTYEGNVDTNKEGIYEITYKVSNDFGSTEKVIKVTVIKNEKPKISAENITIKLNDNFDYLKNVKAIDKEDGEIEVTYEGEVDTSKVGDYKVTYFATDKNGQMTSKTITVSVIDAVVNDNLTGKDGWFHLEDLSFENDKLKVSGFNIISGISNSKNDLIKHQLILESQNDENRYIFNLDRWFDNIPFIPNDGSKNDYSGSWFSGEVTLREIPQGDYTMYIYTYSNYSYTKQILSNIEYTDSIERTYKDSNKRGYLVRENPVLPTVDLELFVRDEGLITYGSVPVRGLMMNDFFDYEFSLNYLYITGSSYTLKTDYKTSDIKREIILEDKKTNKIVYRQDVGLTVGPYKIDSISKNDLTNAWFKAKVDLSKLDSSTYVIYLRTKVGNSDGYDELVDYAYSDLSQSTFVGTKKIKLIRNNKQRVRLELMVE